MKICLRIVKRTDGTKLTNERNGIYIGRHEEKGQRLARMETLAAKDLYGRTMNSEEVLYNLSVLILHLAVGLLY